MVIKTKVYKENIGGLDKRTAEGSQDPRTAVDLDGVILANDGAISKLPGRAQTVTGKFSSAPVRFLTYFDDSAGARTYVAYTDDGGTATWWSWTDTNTATSLGTVTAGGEVDATQFTGLLILTGTKFVPQKWSGSGSIGALGGWAPAYGTEPLTETTNSTMPTPGANPSLCEEHEQRLWFSGDSGNPSHIYYSVMYNAESWVNSSSGTDRGGAMPIREKDGAGKITAIASWGEKGLVVFKERKTYFIIGKTSGAVSASNPFRISDLVIPYGTNSRHSVVKQENDILFLDQHGYFRSLSLTLTNAEAETNNTAYRIQSLLDKIPRRKALRYAHASDYIKRNQIRLYHYKDYAEFSVDSDVRALYHLDTVNDSSGNTLTLTATNAPTLFLGFNNYLEDAYHLNGTNQYLRRSAAAGTNASTAYTALAVEAYAMIDVLPGSGDKDRIFSEDSNSGSFELYLWNDGGTQKVVAAITDSGGTERTAIWTTTLSTATWYYFAMTWDAATITLYVNGTSRATQAWAGTIRTANGNGFAIGAIAAGSSGYFDGKIDEVRVSKITRASDVIATFNSGVTKTNNVEAIIDYSKAIVDKNNNPIRPWTKSTDIVKAPCSMFIDQRLFTGTYDGEIHEQDSGSTHGAPHGTLRREGYYTTAWLDGGVPEQEKRALTIRVWLTAFGTGGLNVESTWESRQGSITRLDLDPDAETTWGDNWTTELIWSSGVGRRLYQFKIHPSGHGKLLQLRFFGWQESVQWTIVYWEIDWEILGARH